MPAELHYVKLGGSLITNKNHPITPRPLVIQRLAREIAAAWYANPQRRLIISHGSGSYGHVVGRRYRTRQGVADEVGWRGFAETGYIAGQLNRLVLAALLQAGLSAISLPPSSLVRCRQGDIIHFWTQPVQAALAAGLVPILYGDVAFDETLGGTIVSTEQVLTALATHLPPQRLTLVGVVDGVYKSDPLASPGAQPIPHLRMPDLPDLLGTLGGSHGIDVTGGMATKVETMAALLASHQQLQIHLISGEIPGRLREHLLHPEMAMGTLMTT